jgi:hypothetical protein
MKSESSGIRNPFGVMECPVPMTKRCPNSPPARSSVDPLKIRNQGDVIEGDWSSRWNGGVDDTIPGDAKDKWKQGRGEVRVVGDRVYLLFDWDHGKRTGLIDARREGANRLFGKYINLTNSAITALGLGL